MRLVGNPAARKKAYNKPELIVIDDPAAEVVEAFETKKQKKDRGLRNQLRSYINHFVRHPDER